MYRKRRMPYGMDGIADIQPRKKSKKKRIMSEAEKRRKRIEAQNKDYSNFNKFLKEANEARKKHIEDERRAKKNAKELKKIIKEEREYILNSIIKRMRYKIENLYLPEGVADKFEKVINDIFEPKKSFLNIPDPSPIANCPNLHQFFLASPCTYLKQEIASGFIDSFSILQPHKTITIDVNTNTNFENIKNKIIKDLEKLELYEKYEQENEDEDKDENEDEDVEEEKKHVHEQLNKPTKINVDIISESKVEGEDKIVTKSYGEYQQPIIVFLRDIDNHQMNIGDTEDIIRKLPNLINDHKHPDQLLFLLHTGCFDTKTIMKKFHKCIEEQREWDKDFNLRSFEQTYFVDPIVIPPLTYNNFSKFIYNHFIDSIRVGVGNNYNITINDNHITDAHLWQYNPEKGLHPYNYWFKRKWPDILKKIQNGLQNEIINQTNQKNEITIFPITSENEKINLDIYLNKKIICKNITFMNIELKNKLKETIEKEFTISVLEVIPNAEFDTSSCLDITRDLQIVSHNYDVDDVKGPIQELANHFSEYKPQNNSVQTIIKYDKFNSLMTFIYSNNTQRNFENVVGKYSELLIPIMIKKIKKLDQEVRELRGEVERLNNRIEQNSNRSNNNQLLLTNGENGKKERKNKFEGLIYFTKRKKLIFKFKDKDGKLIPRERLKNESVSHFFKRAKKCGVSRKVIAKGKNQLLNDGVIKKIKNKYVQVIT